MTARTIPIVERELSRTIHQLRRVRDLEGALVIRKLALEHELEELRQPNDDDQTYWSGYAGDEPARELEYA